MGSRVLNEGGGNTSSSPGLRVAPALATLLLVLLCLQVTSQAGTLPMSRTTHSPGTLIQVLLNPANGPIPYASGSSVNPSQRAITTTATTTTTTMMFKDSRRLYTRRQQAVLPTGVGSHHHADDPFEPKLNTQLWSWYKWLLVGGDEQGNTTSAMPAGMQDAEKAVQGARTAGT